MQLHEDCHSKSSGGVNYVSTIIVHMHAGDVVGYEGKLSTNFALADTTLAKDTPSNEQVYPA